ncbi:MAG: hypothetical protein K0R54_2756 [Clostridiaceae bacterium]|jgi:molybdate-binding protein|nr:hypothetical protein [Clostridiaceae bacterium]MDF2950474.1 hypothetical protein [Anaerocolumna sp.]
MYIIIYYSIIASSGILAIYLGKEHISSIHLDDTYVITYSKSLIPSHVFTVSLMHSRISSCSM